MSDIDPLLEICNLTVARGGSRVLQIPSFVLHRNETVALIGPNGAGKSSFLLALAGLLPLESGEIFFRKQAIVPGFASTEYTKIFRGGACQCTLTDICMTSKIFVT
ncbi:MAG: ATP-binding cassette domain-containing protein [Deltaproteobacteria bacterium]|nr:ATP-binding cassette domain-containing protein [Deltaproteobacteria bacterium]